MMYLLDTNVISELRKLTSGRAHPNVVQWSATHPLTQCHLSTVTVKELEYGLLLVGRRDPDQGWRLRDWVEQVIRDFTDRTFPIDTTIARRAARLHVPDPAPEADAYIAATALVHDLTLVTRNTTHFTRFDSVTIANPWD